MTNTLAALLPDVKAAFMRRQANFEEQAKRSVLPWFTTFKNLTFRNEDFYKMQEEINNDQSNQNTIINEANESNA